MLSSVYLLFPWYLKSCLFRSTCYCFSGIYLLTASSRVGFTCLILLCSWGNVGRKGTIKSIHFMEWYKHVFSWIDDTEYKALLICASPKGLFNEVRFFILLRGAVLSTHPERIQNLICIYSCCLSCKITCSGAFPMNHWDYGNSSVLFLFLTISFEPWARLLWAHE